MKILTSEPSTLPSICPLNTKHVGLAAVTFAVLYGADGRLFCEE